MNIFTTDECVLCLDAMPTILFAPCNHVCACGECAGLVLAAALACPMCRQVIAQHRVAMTLEGDDVIVPVESAIVAEFKQERRKNYVECMGRAKHTANAAFKGKSKFARSVSSAIGNELERRRAENTGTERVQAPNKKVAFERVGEDTLVVTWKVTRKPIVESHPYMELDAALADLAADGEAISTLDLATWWPEYYWNIRHHAGSVERTLQLAGLLSGKRIKK